MTVRLIPELTADLVLDALTRHPEGLSGRGIQQDTGLTAAQVKRAIEHIRDNPELLGTRPFVYDATDGVYVLDATPEQVEQYVVRAMKRHHSTLANIERIRASQDDKR